MKCLSALLLSLIILVPSTADALFSAGVESLYLKPEKRTLTEFLEEHNSTDEITFKNIHPRNHADWGFRVYANLNLCGVFVEPSYTWYEATTATDAYLRQSYENLDARLGCRLFKVFYPYINGRYAKIDIVSTNSQFLEGKGLGLGLAAQVPLLPGIHLSARAGFTPIYATIKTQNTGIYNDGNDPATVTFDNDLYSDTTLISALDARVALGYTTKLGPFPLTLAAGYHYECYKNLTSYLGPGHFFSPDFTFHLSGPYLSLSLNF